MTNLNGIRVLSLWEVGMQVDYGAAKSISWYTSPRQRKSLEKSFETAMRLLGVSYQDNFKF